MVAVVLVTGMSGTGKSAALAELARRGHRVVDTDYGGYSEEVSSSGPGGLEQVWREDRVEALLDGHDNGVLFVSGCVSNQGRFYPRFDAVVLLSAPAAVILERVAGRESNAFGKRDGEQKRILDDLASVEPLLRASATTEIDTRAGLGEVVDAVEWIADSVQHRLDGSSLNALSSRRQQMRQHARARKPSWMSSRRSVRIRSRRRLCSQAKVRSTTQRCFPRPDPCSVSRRAMIGLTPRCQRRRRYLSWS